MRISRSFIIALAVQTVACSFDPDARPTPADAGWVDAGADVPRAADTGAIADEGRATDGGAFDLTAPQQDLATADQGGDVGSDMEADTGLQASGTTVIGDRLVLLTDLEADVENCPATQDCADLDLDRLVDRWEDLVLEAFRPWIVLDEEESLSTDPDAVLLHVGRVTPLRRRPLEVQVYLTILYHRDYGSCGTLSSHNGDSERVVFTLEVTPGAVAMTRLHTAAHENTLADQSTQLLGPELGGLEYDRSTPGAARWIAYASKDKHASYPTKAICESTSPLPCFSEKCGPRFADGSSTARLLDTYNAGEPDAPLIEDLGPIGFGGEDAWADQSFCGGLMRGLSCPGSVREKLIEDPF